ncbi:MAG: hypothetical protein EHM70_11670 [Chloroflexota bacterium]|nr:MAG: hypothetical protein EHM70_11670 [Chloroflexota bacterium]
MPLPPEVMRVFLVLCLFGMALLGILFLRRRNLPFWSYVGWSFLVIFLPVVGPFLAILIKPGQKQLPPHQVG